MHIGTKYHSGRYPYGSGENPYQHDPGFYGQVKQLRKEGWTDAEIAKARGITTTQLRAIMAIERNRQWAANSSEALRLKEKGYSNVAIGERMGVPESTVRNWLKESTKAKNDVLTNTADVLRSHVGKNRYLDIGMGTENQLGISQSKLRTAASMLEAEGYHIYKVKVNQVFGNNQQTEMLILAPPEATFTDVVKNKDRIKTVEGYSNDNMRTFQSFEKIQSVDSNRIQVHYDSELDGVIELRRGVEDLSLGQAQYAQVRIGVDDTNYLKGMAIYRDNMPKGVDIIYNTNKKDGTPLINSVDPEHQVSKSMKEVGLDDPGVFGAIVRQQKYTGSDGKEHLSAVNIVNEEGDWGKWSKTLSSQVLSKQKPDLAEGLLKKVYDAKEAEFKDISSLTNPAVKKALLSEFADSCDSAAVHLKAAAMPRQASHAILPLTDIKENEIFAPNYRDGERVVLIRYPHGGKAEIPELIVNNKGSKQAKESFPNAKDAVGIHPNVAQQLSGADFDGDTVLVIPNNNRQIKTNPPLSGLKNFDPKIAYPAYEGMPKMSKKTRGIEMGKVTNLITDMTLHGASDAELTRAIKHSMVVIDAEKHNLNYKQSYIDNGIAQLKKKYQGSEQAGASTLISRASAEVHLPARKEVLSVSKMTSEEKAAYDRGEKVYRNTGETYINKKTGKEVMRTTTSTRMAEAKDAYSLSSGSAIEAVYADHANKMKALANEARRLERTISPTKYSPSAKKAYESEVSSLKSKLNTALKNKPRERQAQVIANQLIDAKKKSNPEIVDDKDAMKKVKSQALIEARARTGANKSSVSIKITDREWDAIQSGAVSHNTLTQILSNTDMDRVKQLATPKASNRGLSNAQIARAKSMLASGRTQAEVADALGVSTSTIRKALS